MSHVSPAACCDDSAIDVQSPADETGLQDDDLLSMTSCLGESLSSLNDDDWLSDLLGTTTASSSSPEQESLSTASFAGQAVTGSATVSSVCELRQRLRTLARSRLLAKGQLVDDVTPMTSLQPRITNTV